MLGSMRLFSKMNETELFQRIQNEISYKYQVDESLAREMTWDFLNLILTVDADMSLVDQLFIQ